MSDLPESLSSKSCPREVQYQPAECKKSILILQIELDERAVSTNKNDNEVDMNKRMNVLVNPVNRMRTTTFSSRPYNRKT
jgi:hypothetical protein